jgi:hypothetical protein
MKKKFVLVAEVVVLALLLIFAAYMAFSYYSAESACDPEGPCYGATTLPAYPPPATPPLELCWEDPYPGPEPIFICYGGAETGLWYKVFIPFLAIRP